MDGIHEANRFERADTPTPSRNPYIVAWCAISSPSFLGEFVMSLTKLLVTTAYSTYTYKLGTISCLRWDVRTHYFENLQSENYPS